MHTHAHIHTVHIPHSYAGCPSLLPLDADRRSNRHRPAYGSGRCPGMPWQASHQPTGRRLGHVRAAGVQTKLGMCVTRLSVPNPRRQRAPDGPLHTLQKQLHTQKTPFITLWQHQLHQEKERECVLAVSYMCTWAVVHRQR